MLTSYNLPLKVVVLAFNACVCDVHSVRNQKSETINNSKFGIWYLKIKILVVT